MRWVRFAILIIIISVVQAGLVDVIAISGDRVTPDLLLILLVFFAIRSNSKDAIVSSFIIGLAADIISMGSIVGAWMITYGLLGSVLSQMHKVVAFQKMPHQAAAILVVAVAAVPIYCFLTWIQMPEATQGMAGPMVWSGLYSAIVGPFLFLPVAWWMGIKTRRMKRY